MISDRVRGPNDNSSLSNNAPTFPYISSREPYNISPDYIKKIL